MIISEVFGETPLIRFTHSVPSELFLVGILWLFFRLSLHLVPDWLPQVKIDAGVAAPDRMTPGYLDHLELGEAVATLVERRNSSHTVFTFNCPADLKTVLLERNL